ncbi:acyl-CoA synthetase (AMP-forming)/AMP-acid ligase II [Catenulispora sp. MAP5-51]|uniref:class I adenylate-forming enzyme family protein n=1 Tax=Catenulispora sp. MAP5-51 TaxID=3156298 RepID=UPI0035183431
MSAEGQDLIARQAATRPDRIAVVDDRPDRQAVRYTYAELDARVAAAARTLAAAAVRPTTTVAWCGRNSAGVLTVIGAIRRLRAVAVPLNPALTVSEAAHILRDSGTEVLCVDAEDERVGELAEQLPAEVPGLRRILRFGTYQDPDQDPDQGPLTGGLLRQPGSEPGSEPRSEPRPEPDSEPPAGADAATPDADIFYTSGTTGRPKGVVRPRPADPASTPLVALMGFVPEDVHLITGPLYHSGPARFATMAQALGNTLVVQYKFEPRDWLRLVDTHRVTASFSAPTPMRMVCALPAETKAGYDRSSLKRFVANAAPWSQTLKHAFLADFPADSLWEVYGSAETGVATALAPADQLRKPGSCGRPVPGVEVVLYDDSGAAVRQPHTNGEVFVRSRSMFVAYRNAPEAYEADRRGEHHSVGDIAYRDQEGYLYIVDRKKDVIISGGMNVYPAEVEAALESSPDVSEAAVVGVPDEHWGERVHAVVVPAGPDVTAAAVLGFARTCLAGYKLPRSIAFTAALPKTGSGKVLRRALREGARSGGEAR